MPIVLFIWHKLIQPLVDRWYGKPKLESSKGEDGGVKESVESSFKEPLSNGGVNSVLPPAENGFVSDNLNGHVKSD